MSVLKWFVHMEKMDDSQLINKQMYSGKVFWGLTHWNQDKVTWVSKGVFEGKKCEFRGGEKKGEYLE